MFEKEDFELFAVEGLEPRMNRLIRQLRPKFEIMGEQLAKELSLITGEEMFAHVAKHARRKTNPPDDSWVAFSSNKRGYKMMPHFQITVWETHLLVQWGIIYEAKDKEKFAVFLQENQNLIVEKLPENYQWSKDHMKPEGKRHGQMAEQDFEELADRLLNNKKGEVMVGLYLDKDEALNLTTEEFYGLVLKTWKRLNYLHQMK